VDAINSMGAPISSSKNEKILSIAMCEIRVTKCLMYHKTQTLNILFHLINIEKQIIIAIRLSSLISAKQRG